MFIKYTCAKCGKTRCFSKIQTDEVICPNCNTVMTTPRADVAVEVMTTPEARYLGDEALFNTIGDRVSKKHRIRHVTK